ncbi:transposase [Pseudomonas protegens]|uniref:IS110 family transposase n=1 Tax=Pseudomonas protegens TaxID=380021 RepID=UPI002882E03F|nr:transposase [Pseudomonas protegens]
MKKSDLKSKGLPVISTRATGVYWIPVYEILETHGLHVVLASARDARAVPERKTDVNDAQWIQRLHSCGLLPSRSRNPGFTQLFKITRAAP